MKHRTRTYYTDGQKAWMWERWKAGWTLHQIAHLFNRAHTSVRGVLAQTGGIRPPQRRRCAIALTLAEREEISRAVAEGQSLHSFPYGHKQRHALVPTKMVSAWAFCPDCKPYFRSAAYGYVARFPGRSQ